MEITGNSTLSSKISSYREIPDQGLERNPLNQKNTQVCFLLLLCFLLQLPAVLSAQTITGPELLGKPTDHSITVNVVANASLEAYFEYGTLSGVYAGRTKTVTNKADVPIEVVMDDLSPNTRYYYRMVYRKTGDASWIYRDEHTFTTQKSAGSPFVFTITSDQHTMFNINLELGMQNILSERPDFNIDLGDCFQTNNMKNQLQVDSIYMQRRNPLYFGAIGASVPIFLTTGNHENEEGWNLDDTPFSVALASVQSRKMFYPTPIPGEGFYSGNKDPLVAIDEATYGDDYREDYYAWEWGDALFVVIDEFQYTMQLPYTPAQAEGADDEFTGDQWTWTLGKEQFDWLKHTLENSKAKYKFIFSHNMTGGTPGDGPMTGYVRGGAEAAYYFEWGGHNPDSTWGFDKHRPGWGGVPIHQIMLANGVSAYFHGHDHQYVYETRDGIVYQEVPSPSLVVDGFNGIYTEGDYGDFKTIKRILYNSGHLKITVTPEEATVQYVRSGGKGASPGDISYTYTIEPNKTNK
jgi:hypothetical protein